MIIDLQVQVVSLSICMQKLKSNLTLVLQGKGRPDLKKKMLKMNQGKGKRGNRIVVMER